RRSMSLRYGQGLDLMAATALEDGVDDRRTLTRIGVTDEQPVLRAEFGRADRLFGEVVVDARLSVFHVGGQLGPLRTGVGDRFSHRALREVFFDILAQRLSDLLEQRMAVLGSDRGNLLGFG